MHPREDSAWEYPMHWPELGEDQVHLWRVRLDGVENEDDHLWEMLSLDERGRAERYRFEQHRARFLRTHGVLRSILSGYVGIPAAELDIALAPGGKPFLKKLSGMDLRFNLSHSGDWMILGIANSREIGVDIELAARDIDWRTIARDYFHPHEIQAINLQPDAPQQLESFFRVWTLKEAYLKALGSGLAGGLTGVEVFIDDGRADDFVTLPDDEKEKRRWQVFTFQPVSGAFGAVIVERRDRCLSLHRFHWQNLGQGLP